MRVTTELGFTGGFHWHCIREGVGRKKFPGELNAEEWSFVRFVFGVEMFE